jgi:hypothetical protein
LIGLNNQQILQNAQFAAQYWMILYGQAWQETWAQEFAAFTGTQAYSVDYYFNAYFPCTAIYVQSLYTTGGLAPLSAYPTSCTN